MATTQTQAPDQWFGAIAHTEIGSNDPAATTTFLNKVFDMSFETTPGPAGGDYHMCYQEGRPSCAVRGVMTENEPGPSQTPYINVENIDNAIDNATANGANVVLPKTAVPKMGWMSWLGIPGGNTIAIWQPDDNAA